jgi:hypothetical protein
MRHRDLLRLSLLFLALALPGAAALIATAPPAAPPDTAPAAAATPPATDAEAQQQAEAEKQAKEKKTKAEAEKQKKLDTERQKQTVTEIRNLGTVLSTWLTEQVAAATAEREAEREASGEPPPEDDVAGTRKKTVNIQDNPVISRDDLEDSLVPQYLAQIPENDAWGNPYEVRINTDNLMARTVISIRSPGRKGYFSGDVYKIEGFDPTDFDQDIVWVDGAFVRWPNIPSR